MSKDTINPDIEKYFNHIRGQLAWIPLEDEHIKAQVEGTLKSVDDLEAALSVPSSPVMDLNKIQDEWDAYEKEHRGLASALDSSVLLKWLSDKGYLIGTRSIVPEMTDEEIEKYLFPDGNYDNGRVDHRNMKNGAIDYRNWLRSQINK